MNFSPMPEETSRLLVQIRKWAGLVGDWLGELLADRYLPLVLVKNPIVYALERFYAVSDRTPALVGARRGLHLQGDLACSAEPSPAQLRRFAIDSMAAMDQLRRFGAIDALVEELSGRQTWLWPFFPKPFSEPEQLQLADRSQVQDRCAMVGQ